jgi:hypothetical protein
MVFTATVGDVPRDLAFVRYYQANGQRGIRRPLVLTWSSFYGM